MVTLTVLTLVVLSEAVMAAPPSGPVGVDTVPEIEPSPLRSMIERLLRTWPPPRSTAWIAGAYPGLVTTSWYRPGEGMLAREKLPDASRVWVDTTVGTSAAGVEAVGWVTVPAWRSRRG